jgi:hypothetical protein
MSFGRQSLPLPSKWLSPSSETQVASLVDLTTVFCKFKFSLFPFKCSQHYTLYQRLLTCGPRTPGFLRLFRKLNYFSQQINKVYIRKKAKSEIENFKKHCKSEGI